MRELTPGILLMFLFSWVITSNLYALSEKEIEKTFEYKEVVKIKLVLGECFLKKSSDQNIFLFIVISFVDSVLRIGAVCVDFWHMPIGSI